jgi:hypothetical protein
LLIAFNNAVATEAEPACRAAISVCVVSVITFFASVSYAIAAAWEGTVGSAAVWLGIGEGIIAVFAAVNDLVTALWQGAVGAAGIGCRVGVGCTGIASFKTLGPWSSNIVTLKTIST